MDSRFPFLILDFISTFSYFISISSKRKKKSNFTTLVCQKFAYSIVIKQVLLLFAVTHTLAV